MSLDCGHPNHGNPDHDCAPFLSVRQLSAEVDRLRAERDQARDIAVALEQENARLTEQREAVLAKHVPVGGSVGLTCGRCWEISWPCPTARALGVTE